MGLSRSLASVVVWASICTSGKMPLVFINRNVKINDVTYQQSMSRDESNERNAEILRVMRWWVEEKAE
ncbi:hypothetical protein KIN20_013572 [Parelaphostrongylus tenuis]|uniref:Uncharacterized protein n=1 Tax=Parelaphostrongylus tenuis TaxID=148309 RepID=A0AAD5MUR9_PARTN|nr:hypothetical protein KIN20_013572 [Parelaphostrongylus tenuis]